MADISTTGNPNLRALINSSGGTSGDFHVRDANLSTNIFSVATGGDVTLTGEVHEAGTIVLYNSSSGASALVDLYQNATFGGKTKRIELVYDGTNSLAKIKASTSGHAMQIEGDTADLNTTNATGTVVKFKTNGTTRLTMEYTSSKPRLTEVTSADYEVTGATSDLTLLAGEHVIFKFGVSAAGECRFLGGGGTTLTKVDESGVWTWNESSGTAEARLTPNDGVAPPNAIFEIGLSDSVRGQIVIKRDPVGGGNNRAGVLVLEAEDGTQGFLWVQAAGAGVYNLRGAIADPGTNDAAGMLIGRIA